MDQIELTRRYKIAIKVALKLLGTLAQKDPLDTLEWIQDVRIIPNTKDPNDAYALVTFWVDNSKEKVYTVTVGLYNIGERHGWVVTYISGLGKNQRSFIDEIRVFPNQGELEIHTISPKDIHSYPY